MTDITNEPAGLPTPEIGLLDQIETLRSLLRTAEDQRNEAKAQVQDLRRQLNGAREALEAGVDGLEDEEFQDQVVEFLNENTPWMFKAEREYRVQITGYVLVTARNEQAAKDIVDNGEWRWMGDIESDGFEVDSAEEA